MKNLRKIFLICLLFFNFNFFAEDNLKSKFIFDEYLSKEIKIKGIYSLTEKDMKEYPEYSMGWLLSFDNVNEIKSFYYFPPYNNEVNYGEGKFVINDQVFITKDIFYLPFLLIDIEGILFSITSNVKKYLILISDFGKYGDKICFIFDITDPDNIKFYPPEERFVCKEVADNFAGIFQNKLCFLFSIWVSDTRLEYKLIPYYIEDNVLKMLCDEKGDAYYVRYYFLDRFEQQIVIEDVHLPDKR